jgi:choline dehydrogenase-like flavoprotein
LYVASSAVFASSGQANSTLLAVALAMRLAHRLAGTAS